MKTGYSTYDSLPLRLIKRKSCNLMLSRLLMQCMLLLVNIIYFEHFNVLSTKISSFSDCLWQALNFNFFGRGLLDRKIEKLSTGEHESYAMF